MICIPVEKKNRGKVTFSEHFFTVQLPKKNALESSHFCVMIIPCAKKIGVYMVKGEK